MRALGGESACLGRSNINEWADLSKKTY